MSYSWGTAFSDSFLSGLQAGKAIKRTAAEREFAEKDKAATEKRDAAYKAADETKASALAEVDKLDTPGRMDRQSALEAAAGIGPTGEAPKNVWEDTTEADPELRTAGGLGRDSLVSATDEQTAINASKDFALDNKINSGRALANKAHADAYKAADDTYRQESNSALRGFYGKTGEVEKLKKLNDDQVWADRIRDPAKRQQFLLNYANQTMTQGGDFYQIERNGTLSMYGKDGTLKANNLPMPDENTQMKMLATAYGMNKLFQGDTSIMKMLGDQDAARGKSALEAAKLQETIRNNDIRNKNYADRTQAGLIKAAMSGTGGATDKSALSYGDPMEDGGVPVTMKGPNGQNIPVGIEYMMKGRSGVDTPIVTPRGYSQAATKAIFDYALSQGLRPVEGARGVTYYLNEKTAEMWSPNELHDIISKKKSSKTGGNGGGKESSKSDATSALGDEIEMSH